MHPILLDLGELNFFGQHLPLRVGSYGALLVLALTLASWLGVRAGRRLAPHAPWTEIVASMILTGVLVAKLWGILLALPALLSGEHSWASGLVSGGHWMPGAVAGLFVGARLLKRHGVPLGVAMNALVLAVPVAHATARLGCLLAGCCHGRPTSVPWGIVYPMSLESAPHSGQGPLGTPLGITLHPSPVYEMLAEAVNLTLCLWLFRRGPKPWQVLACWATLYGVERFAFELLRGGEAVWLGPLTSNQWIALGAFVVGAGSVLSMDRRSMGLLGRLLPRLSGALGLGLVALTTLLDLGCVLVTDGAYTRPLREISCSAITLRHVESDMRRVVDTNTPPFASRLYACPPTVAGAADLWLRHLAKTRGVLCASVGASPTPDQMFFCQPGTYCRENEPICRPNDAVTSLCTAMPTTPAPPLCPLPPAERPRLRVVDSSGLEVTRYDFGVVPVGELRSVTFRAQNAGGGILVVRPPSIAQWMSDTMSLGSFPAPVTDCGPNPLDSEEVAAGGARLGAGARSECSVTVRFGPNDGTPRHVLLQVPYDDGVTGNSFLDLVGQGQPGTLLLEPADRDPANPMLSPNLCFNVPRVGGCYERPLRLTAVGAQVRLRELILPAGYTSVPARIGLPDMMLGLPDDTLRVMPGTTQTILIRWCGAGTPPAGTLQLNTNAAPPSAFLIRALPPATMCSPMP